MFLYVELDESLKFLIQVLKLFKFKLHTSDHQQVTSSHKGWGVFGVKKHDLSPSNPDSAL